MADKIQDYIDQAENLTVSVQDAIGALETEYQSWRAVVSRIREMAEEINRSPEDTVLVETQAQQIMEAVDHLG